MLLRLLGIDDGAAVTFYRLYLRSPWPGLIALVLIAAGIAFSVWLYRREHGPGPRERWLLAALRGVLLGLIALLLFEPVFGVEMTVKLRKTLLVLVDVSRSMSFPVSERGAETRMDAARKMLGDSQANAFAELQRDMKVHYFYFGEKLEPTAGEGEMLPESLRSRQPAGESTRLGAALREAAARYSGQPIAGVVVLTDGASNEGVDPLEAARDLGKEGIPVYPVGIGVAQPDDVAVANVIVQETVFSRDTVPVRVQIDSRGYAAREAEVVLKLAGEEKARAAVTLAGGTEFAELTFTPGAAGGNQYLEVSIAPLPGEAGTDNNRALKAIRVIDDKIKVLYVEGKPRWEYRYLRAVLLRDHRLDVKFLLTEGDPELARASDRYIGQYPRDPAEAFAYDLVILGDVPAGYFSTVQLERIEQLVRERGGSFLMLAGHRHAPGSYVGSAIEPLLPVKAEEDVEQIDDTVHPVATRAGLDSMMACLELPESRNAELWSLVKPLYSVPRVSGAKPGAVVIAELSDSARRAQPYPLISWQRYGAGKSMLVATDQLWRLRFKRGDKYHARFWGQAIQFLTLSRLLGENKRIRIEAGKRECFTGERVEVFANVLNESFAPVSAESFTVFVQPPDSPSGPGTPLKLQPVPDVPGLYQGLLTPQQEGVYRITAGEESQEISNAVELRAASAQREMLQPAMQKDVLEKVAALSGGKCLAARDLPALGKTLDAKPGTAAIRREVDLWDSWAVLVVIVGCAGAEWYGRRRRNLV